MPRGLGIVSSRRNTESIALYVKRYNSEKGWGNKCVSVKIEIVVTENNFMKMITAE